MKKKKSCKRKLKKKNLNYTCKPHVSQASPSFLVLHNSKKLTSFKMKMYSTHFESTWINFIWTLKNKRISISHISIKTKNIVNSKKLMHTWTCISSGPRYQEFDYRRVHIYIFFYG